jgi:hypothetical protein
MEHTQIWCLCDHQAHTGARTNVGSHTLLTHRPHAQWLLQACNHGQPLAHAKPLQHTRHHLLLRRLLAVQVVGAGALHWLPCLTCTCCCTLHRCVRR